MNLKKRILVAPLNWGLGHATRCIPIINALSQYGFEPIIASDGLALELLRKEFPSLTTLELPSYNVSYTKDGKWFKVKIIRQSPKLLKAIKAEKKATRKLIEEYNISGIISDNRLGVYSRQIPSVFMTHQLQVLSGNTTWISTRLHQKFIKRFTECWIPDNNGKPNLTGKLGHLNKFEIPLKYIGPISRFKKINSELKFNLMVLISGPEPQRSLFEELILNELESCKKKVLIVNGLIENKQTITEKGSLTIYNYMTSNQLEKSINESEMILSRSGYTTIMDLAKLDKKAFFVPTPGQFEQEYLARYLEKQKIVPYCIQDDFSIDKLKEVEDYKGLSTEDYEINFKKLFSLFQGK